jgi:hypothetical protein
MDNVMKSVTACVLAVLLCAEAAFAGLNSRKALYVGGTVSMREGTEGILTTKDASFLIFTGGKGEAFKIDYTKVTELAYGQHAGRRVGTTIALGVTTMGVRNASLSHRHLHESPRQREDAAIFELGRDVIR